MNEQEVNKKFDEMIHTNVVQQIVKERRPPAKFPELRYLWGITALGSFALLMLVSIISVAVESFR